MEIRAAKELLHVQTWLDRVDEVTAAGEEHYLNDFISQEAGDSLMMKLGEAANRIAKLGVLAPDGVDWALAIANRNFIIHQYEQLNRKMTWLTLAVDLPHWKASLEPLFRQAREAVTADLE